MKKFVCSCGKEIKITKVIFLGGCSCLCGFRIKPEKNFSAMMAILLQVYLYVGLFLFFKGDYIYFVLLSITCFFMGLMLVLNINFIFVRRPFSMTDNLKIDKDHIR